MDGEILILYLAISEYSISAVLIRKEEQVQCPVYYVSKGLQDAETWYPSMEKLAYALILASWKLRPYFQSHKIEVRTAYPLRKVLHKPEASEILMKWEVELGMFDIEYKPRTTIKGRALADFILEFQPEFEITGDECVLLPPRARLPDNNEALWWNLYVDEVVNENGAGAGIELISSEGYRFQSSIHFGFKVPIMRQNKKH